MNEKINKIYIAQRHVAYEGFVILGVFSTKELAGKCCNDDLDEYKRLIGDGYSVTEHEVKEN